MRQIKHLVYYWLPGRGPKADGPSLVRRTVTQDIDEKGAIV